MPRWLIFAACIVTVSRWCRWRSSRAPRRARDETRIHVVPDMDAQAKLKAQQVNRCSRRPGDAPSRARHRRQRRGDRQPALTAGRTPAASG